LENIAAMAPFGDEHGVDAVGCRQDWRAARRERAIARRDDSQDKGPRSASPMTGVGAAILGSAMPSASAQGAPNHAKQSYAAALAEQLEEKRSRLAHERLANQRAEGRDTDRVSREAGELNQEVHDEVGKQRQREANVLAREDSLTRFLAEQNGSAASNGTPRRVAAGSAYPSSDRQGRSHSQPAHPGSAPWAMDGKQQDGPAPPIRHGGGAAPYAMQSEQAVEPRGLSRPRGRSPFAMDEGQPPAFNDHRGFGSAAPPRSGMPPRLPQGGEGGKQVSSNVYASGSNQNCGNVISDRPTSRVLQPPGGGSSFSFA